MIHSISDFFSVFDPEDALALEFGIGVLFCVFTNFFFLIVEPFGFSWWVGTLLECVVNILMQGGVLEILRLKLVRRLDKSKNKCVRAVSCFVKTIETYHGMRLYRADIPDWAPARKKRMRLAMHFVSVELQLLEEIIGGLVCMLALCVELLCTHWLPLNFNPVFNVHAQLQETNVTLAADSTLAASFTLPLQGWVIAGFAARIGFDLFNAVVVGMLLARETQAARKACYKARLAQRMAHLDIAFSSSSRLQMLRKNIEEARALLVQSREALAKRGTSHARLRDRISRDHQYRILLRIETSGWNMVSYVDALLRRRRFTTMMLLLFGICRALVLGAEYSWQLKVLPVLMPEVYQNQTSASKIALFDAFMSEATGANYSYSAVLHDGVCVSDTRACRPWEYQNFTTWS